MNTELPEGWIWETSLYAVRDDGAMVYTDGDDWWHALKPNRDLEPDIVRRSAYSAALALNEKKQTEMSQCDPLPRRKHPNSGQRTARRP